MSRIRDTGESLGRASKWVTGKSWNAARLRTGLSAASGTMTELGFVSTEAEALIAEGMTLTAPAATGGISGALTAIGTWIVRKVIGDVAIGSAAAIGIGALTVAAVGGLLVYGAANLLGGLSGDACQPGGQGRQGREDCKGRSSDSTGGRGARSCQ